MGYTTEFRGQINIDPPLNDEEMVYLQRFNETRRMNRTKGPYFVDGKGFHGQDHEADIIDYNNPPKGQPGLWCQWIPNEDGTALVWDEGEKFYDSVEWMEYIIEHFLAPDAKAKGELDFLQANHILNGVIKAQGEDFDDRWKMIVENNKVRVEQLE